jgi:hypothetical protein
MRRATLAVGLCVSLIGCGGPEGTPHDASAIFRPADMVADRERAAPGDFIEIRFPQEMVRGLLYVLEEETGSSWAYRYALISDANGGQPSWQLPEGVAVDDIGIGGTGPDRLVIPNDASPGSYRICTGNAVDNVCVRLEIVAPPA